MLHRILMVSTALCAISLITTIDTPKASAAMGIALPTSGHSPAQLVAYEPLVYRAQVELSRKGFDTGTPDGKMGPRTRVAIEAYQRANGMSITGSVSDSLVAQLEGNPTARADRAVDRRGDRMSRSELIGQTQAELRRHGYTITNIGGGLNGETTDAIQSYQQSHGLERTGTPSEQLLATMRRDSVAVSPSQPARIDRPADRRGARISQNDLIGQTQAELRRHGYTITNISNGLNGETTDAIQSYQQSHGLERTGTPSEQLLATMRRDRSVDQSGTRISQKDLISQTQAELRRHGYTITYVGDGLNGETADAIRGYQQSRGLERTGTPSETLLALLRSDNGMLRPATPTPIYQPVAPAQPVLCADFLHQGRPGGTDYNGPPVPGCPSN